ncbi:VOC family protein [Azospirillum griseum]|uniref:VOC family protein n=1 Tax=Azospirillum griseum TaxID=2496639 RepID=A0A3S0K9D2_9PROT|nr:VOC family protein [Azospirillum griseum]RTR17612.1 VOC family protein [Azospirillum griseum]
MTIQPYLFFAGRCDEAIAFYQQALNATVVLRMGFSDAPEPCPDGMLPPGWSDKVMHATLQIGDATVMMSDGQSADGPTFHGFSLSLSVADAAEAERVFTALAAEGTVQMPLGATFYSPCFGMVRDRFGLSWMVIVPM